MDGAAEGVAEDVISVARQLWPAGGGAWAAVESLDTASGEARARVLWLDAAGRPGTPPEAAAGEPPPGGPFASLDLAAAVVPALARWREAAGAALGGGRARAQSVACDGRSLWLLEGDRDAPDGRAQALHRLSLPPRPGAAAERLDLAPLRLSAARAVTAMALDGGWASLFVASATAGFELWRAPAWSREPRFEAAIARGAHRFALDAAVSALLPWPGGLLAGTAALAEGPGRAGSWGPELLLIRPDGDWDLVWGQPRFTPQGLKRPLSGAGPGLGRADNAAVKALAALPDGGVLALLQDFSGDPVPARARARPDFLDYAGGARLLRGSADLGRWAELPVRWPGGPGGFGAMAALAAVGTGVLVGHEGAADAPPVTALALP